MVIHVLGELWQGDVSPNHIALIRLILAAIGARMVWRVWQTYSAKRQEAGMGQDDGLQKHRKVVIGAYAVFLGAVLLGTLVLVLGGNPWFALGLGIVGGVAAIVGAIGLGWLIVRER